MGLSFCLLASGSRGNAILVQAGSEAVLVDCGLSGRELFGRLERAGLDHRHLTAIIVTHEHRDHVAGVGVVARKLRLPFRTRVLRLSGRPCRPKLQAPSSRSYSSFSA